MEIIIYRDQLEMKYTNDDDLLTKLIKLYSYQGYVPKITINGNLIKVSLDQHAFDNTQREFNLACELCNQGKYKEAEPHLKTIIEICPLHADAHRILAQTYMMQKRFNDAIDANIESLRIDPTNAWTLILMGNIYAQMNDVATSMTYYNEALKFHPNDPIATNNVAAALMEQDKYEEAEPLFKKVLEINSTYVNAYYGLAQSYLRRDLPQKAWKVIEKANKNALDRKENPRAVEELQKLKIGCAKRLYSELKFEPILSKELSELNNIGGRRIEIAEDLKSYLGARLEYGPAHKRDYHIIHVNPNKEYHEHLILHELVHLRMNILASQTDNNKLLFSDGESYDKFVRRFSHHINKLSNQIGTDESNKVFRNMFQGMVLQMFNCPLDLFVEDYIYEHYPEMRPIQLLSLFNQEQDYISSAESGLKMKNQIPPQILSTNKMLSLVSSIQFEEQFGLNFQQYYKPTKKEFDIAKDIYEEYLAYKGDYKPGEEYDFVMFVFKTMNFEEIIYLLPESEFTLANIKQDTHNAQLTSEDVDERNAEFRKSHKDGEDPAETMMMTMYMLGALRKFESLTKRQVAIICSEIAVIGQTGIDPQKKSGYIVPSLPGEDFGGYRLLAYYYVSAFQAFPKLLPKLGLPFDEAYYQALLLYNKKD